MTVSARSLVNYQVEINTGSHVLVSDEPPDLGDGAGPGPFDLLLSGLASCTIITLHMYARRKEWPLEGVEMTLEMHSVETGVGPQKQRSSVIETQLTFSGPLTNEQMKRLEEIASRCPVHRTLRGEIEITTAVTNLTVS